MTRKNDQMLEELEKMKDLRPKTIQIENVRAQILAEIESHTNDLKRGSDCQREMAALLTERQLHIDAIAEIDNDVAKLQIFKTNSQKQEELSKKKALELYDMYLILKEEIDAERHTIGLDCLPELTEIKHLLDDKKT